MPKHHFLLFPHTLALSSLRQLVHSQRNSQKWNPEKHGTIKTKLNSLIYMRWDLIRENDLIAFFRLLRSQLHGVVSACVCSCWWGMLACIINVHGTSILFARLSVYLLCCEYECFLSRNYIIGTNRTNRLCSSFDIFRWAIFFLPLLFVVVGVQFFFSFTLFTH